MRITLKNNSSEKGAISTTRIKETTAPKKLLLNFVPIGIECDVTRNAKTAKQIINIIMICFDCLLTLFTQNSFGSIILSLKRNQYISS